MVVVLCGVFGCDEQATGPAPINVPEYSKMGQAERTRWPDNRILQINLTRVSNAELPTPQRIDSLRLISQIARKQNDLLSEADLADMTTLLRDANCPKELHEEVLVFLLEQNYPDLSAFIAGVMEDSKASPRLRDAVSKYIGSNPPPQMLAGIVRSWSNVKSIAGPNELNFRNAVEKISGKKWDETLLAELNSPTFEARGEALQVLRARLGVADLRQRILNLHPRTEEMQAVQMFLEQFDYLPVTREELMATAVLFKVRRDMIPDAARVCLDWSKNYKYRFNIRDFHLLSRLARDPLRSNLKRTQMVLEIGQAIKTRRHVPHTPAAPGGPDDYKENFWLQVDRLSLADLWNLYLLNEMLSRPRVQVALRLMADGDLKDPRTAWGGLVFYQNGQAEATLYPPDKDIAGDDLTYHPTKRMVMDGRDSLCRFIGHFDQLNNSLRAGPSAEELADARLYNYYGVILTRTDKNSFCAHYLNPDGVVVSLGKFPLR